MTISAIAAASRVFTTSSPIAHTHSQIPVKYTIPIGCGKTLGTIRAISYFVVVKCAKPVNTNIAARPNRAEPCRLASAATPSAPIPRDTSHDANSTINAAKAATPCRKCPS